MRTIRSRVSEAGPEPLVTAKRAYVGILLVLVVWLGLDLRATVGHATSDAKNGEHHLLAGVQTLRAGGLSPSNAQTGEAVRNFQSSEADFTRASAALANDPFFRLVRHIPVVGWQVTAAAGLSDSGTHLARIARTFAEAAALNATAGQDKTAAPGERILAIMETLGPKLSQVDGELAAVRKDRSTISSWGLLPQLASSVTALDTKLKLIPAGTITNLRADLPGIKHFLGGTEPQTYLVLNQDPAELRGTGGFVGTIAFMSFDKGKMAPFQAMDIDRIDTDKSGHFVLGGPGTANHVDSPYPLQAAFHLPSWELRDANWSPDFPTAAADSEFLLQREAGIRVGGVIAVDPYLIERLLAVTGPIKVPETGDIVDEHNFFAISFSRSELDYSAHRKDFIGQAAREIVGKLLSLPSTKWPAVLDALRWGCEARSLQAYFHDTEAEAFANRHKCGGQVQSRTGDSLMVVEANVGGNKDDFWMKRSYSLDLEVKADGGLRHTLKLHYFGLTSHGDLTGPYRGWLRLYLPAMTSVVSVDGAKLDQAKEFGHQVLQGWFSVQFDKTTDLTVIYDESASTTSPDHRHLVFYWQKQAGQPAVPITLATLPNNRFTAAASNTATAPGKISTDLSVDREFSFEIRR